ncbi:MAG: hypothetical protein JRJ59_03490 [Deltaproteobacteria bacterium]|nr:hypothetical protein [Deltaproteobacteria bacterium]
MRWLFLAAYVVFFPVANLSAKKLGVALIETDGFKDRILVFLTSPSTWLAAFGFSACALSYFLFLARTQIGISAATFTGLGLVLGALTGRIGLGERLAAVQWLAIVLILAGVALINLPRIRS